MVHVGVDLHKRSSQLAVLMPDGEVTQQRLENDPKRLEQFFAQLPPGARIAIEASGTWWWLVDLVERLGHHAVLSNPKQTKAIAGAVSRMTGSMPSGWPCSFAVTCCPPCGSPQPDSGRHGSWCATE